MNFNFGSNSTILVPKIQFPPSPKEQEIAKWITVMKDINTIDCLTENMNVNEHTTLIESNMFICLAKIYFNYKPEIFLEKYLGGILSETYMYDDMVGNLIFRNFDFAKRFFLSLEKEYSFLKGTVSFENFRKKLRHIDTMEKRKFKKKNDERRLMTGVINYDLLPNSTLFDGIEEKTSIQIELSKEVQQSLWCDNEDWKEETDDEEKYDLNTDEGMRKHNEAYDAKRKLREKRIGFCCKRIGDFINTVFPKYFFVDKKVDTHKIDEELEGDDEFNEMKWIHKFCEVTSSEPKSFFNFN